MTHLLNLKQPYGMIYGHDTARYQQGDKLFDAQYRLISPPKAKEVSMAGLTGEVDPLESSKAFLLNILKQNPLSKSVIYKEVENNNQSWDQVRDAALSLGIVKYSQKNLEYWKLPEGEAA
jgi:hypothetical protein